MMMMMMTFYWRHFL